MSAPSGTTNRGVLVIAVVVVVALIGGVVWWKLQPEGVQPGVVFVGDSVTYLSISQINEALGPKAQPAYLTRVGWRSSDLLPLFAQEVIKRRAGHQALRQVALLMGYNDVLQGNVESAALDKVVALASQFSCAVWLTLPPTPSGRAAGNPKFRADLARRWNERLGVAVRSHHNIHLVTEWQRTVDASPPGHLLVADGVHPNAAGQRVLAGIYAHALRTDCRR
jgi:lysophospholipase L1-like esterase